MLKRFVNAILPISVVLMFLNAAADYRDGRYVMASIALTAGLLGVGSMSLEGRANNEN